VDNLTFVPTAIRVATAGGWVLIDVESPGRYLRLTPETARLLACRLLGRADDAELEQAYTVAPEPPAA
jgi:hypothetical protein